jgi:hypothetical protein
MYAIDNLKKLLKKLEAEAKHVLAAAATDGRFDEVIDLAQLAKEISDLASRWNCSEAPSVDDRPCRPTSERPRESQLTQPKKGAYPKFIREKDELVKIGWSAKERKTYEHRASKSIVNAVARAVSAKGKSGHRFSIDDVMKSISHGNESELIPSYQVYAAMLWLKWSGMLLQHGRQGYTVVRPQTFDSSLETAWKSLPQR